MSVAMQRRPVCVVAGVGPSSGEAFARRFAAEGYAVALLARGKDRIEALAAELATSWQIVALSLAK
jgi:NADP-dependent 3-hydroxy acid dehydrogenase YdfG